MQVCPSCSSNWIVMSVQRKSAKCLACETEWTMGQAAGLAAASKAAAATQARKPAGAVG